MAVPSSLFATVGFRNLRVFALDSNGYMAATTSTTAYEGIRVTKSKVLTLTHPEARLIIHHGDDRIFSLDTLPPTEPLTGEITLANFNLEFDALVGNVLVVTQNEIKMILVASDQQGNEPLVGLFAYQQGLDADDTSAEFNERRWHFAMMPKAWCIKRMPPANADAANPLYTVRPNFVTKYLTGNAFASTTEGATQAQLVHGVANYKPKLVAWKSTTSGETFYPFPTATPAVSGDTMGIPIVCDAAALKAANVTYSTTGITLSSTTVGNIISCMYETS